MAVRPAAALLALLALAAPLAALPAAAQTDAPTPRLVALAAGYGPEAWKDEPPLGGVAGGLPVPAPSGALGVYANPYADGAPHQGAAPWFGYNATATLELQDARGAPVTGTAHYVAARLRTDAGDIPAKLARLAPGRFSAAFDLDGENGDDRFPAAPPGRARIAVEVYERAPEPTLADRRVATADFQVEFLPASLDLGGFALDDAALGFGDTGPGNRTLVHPRLARPGQAFTLVADLGAADAPAAVVAWHRGRGVTLAEGRTDAQGRLTASVGAGQLTGGNLSGLALVEAHLDGGAGRLASTALAVAVSAHDTRVSRLAYESRAVGGGAADDLLVEVLDPSAGEERAARGTLHVLDPTGGSAASVPFDPPSFAPASDARTARLPGLRLPADAPSYRLLALFQTADGRLYSMAQAVRGLDVVVGDARAAPFEPGNLTLRLRNLNSNLDEAVDEGLAMEVRVQVAGLPGGAAFDQVVDVPEQGEARLDVPFRGDAGAYTLAINATSGELRRDAAARVLVEPPPRSPLPALEPALALAALGALALHRRRTRS